jgi:amphi-Trp domain-containing protein
MESTTAVGLEEREDSASATDDGDGGPDAARGRKDKGRIKFESVMQRNEAVVYFGALLDGLKHGQLQFRHGEKLLSLAPTDQLAVEITASRKDNKETVCFELEWKRCTSDALGTSE